MEGKEQIVLETKRTKLTLLEPNHAHELMAILGSETVMKSGGMSPMTEEQIRDYIKEHILPSYAQNGWGRFAVIKKDSKELIGYAGLGKRDVNGEQMVDIGYGFALPYWNQRYATEVVQALVSYARIKAGLPGLVALIYPDNEISKKVARKAGLLFGNNSTYNGKPIEVYRITF